MPGQKKRKTRAFQTREEADKFLAEKKGLRRLHGDAAMALAPDVALRYAAVEDRLAAAGVTIEQAADYFLEHHKPVKERLTLGVRSTGGRRGRSVLTPPASSGGVSR